MIDLHLHLDGAVTVDIARKLASVQGITLPTDNDEKLLDLLSVPSSCESLNDFLKCFDLPLSLMQTKEGLSEAVRLLCDDLKKQGLVYAEIKYAPQLHTQKGMTQEEAVLASLEGLKRSDMKCNLILCCMRGKGNEDANNETIDLAAKYLVKDGGVVAIDLAGAEALFPTSDYSDIFKRASELGIPYTIHAGEADGPESVRCAIEYGTKRIGHGVRSVEDPALVELIKEKGIFLEMCPTSNRQTCAIPDMSKYPLTAFLEKGIRVTVNTDDPGIERTTLAGEYRYLEDTFGLTKEQEKILLANSIDAAFTTDEVKASLRQQLSIA